MLLLTDIITHCLLKGYFNISAVPKQNKSISDITIVRVYWYIFFYPNSKEVLIDCEISLNEQTCCGDSSVRVTGPSFCIFTCIIAPNWPSEIAWNWSVKSATHNRYLNSQSNHMEWNRLWFSDQGVKLISEKCNS